MVVSLRAGFYFLSLLAAPLSAVQAQDIGVAFDQIPPGTVYEFIDSDQRTFQIEIIGATSDGFLEYTRGFDPDDAALGERWIGDAAGNALQVELPGGTIYRYQPHNCRRTLGTCSYVEIGPNGERRHLNTIEATPNGFIARYYVLDEAGKQEFRLESSVVLDEDGVVLEAKRTYPDGTRYSYRRITNGTS